MNAEEQDDLARMMVETGAAADLTIARALAANPNNWPFVDEV